MCWGMSMGGMWGSTEPRDLAPTQSQGAAPNSGAGEAKPQEGKKEKRQRERDTTPTTQSIGEGTPM